MPTDGEKLTAFDFIQECVRIRRERGRAASRAYIDSVYHQTFGDYKSMHVPYTVAKHRIYRQLISDSGEIVPSKVLANGREIDASDGSAYEIAMLAERTGGEETAMNAAKTASAKPRKNRLTEKAPEKEQTVRKDRIPIGQKVMGHSVSALSAWMGVQGYSVESAKKVFDAHKVDYSVVNVKTGISAGRHLDKWPRTKVAQVTKEQEAEIKKIVGHGPEDEEPVRKGRRPAEQTEASEAAPTKKAAAKSKKSARVAKAAKEAKAAAPAKAKRAKRVRK